MPKVVAAVISSRQERILDCLETLYGQDLPQEAYRILVVAEYDPPGELSDRVDWIGRAPRSITTKRNMCLREYPKGVIAFLDDDCLADAHWLRTGMEYLESHPEAAGVQGRIVVPEPKKSNPNYGETSRLSRPLYQTSNIFYRAEKLLEFGGFDERFAFQREDVDMGFTLVSNGQEIGFAPEATVKHPVREGEYWNLIWAAYRKRYDPLLVRKHPRLFRKHFGRIIPGSFWSMIALFAAGIGMVILLDQGRGLSVVPPLIGATGLTIRRHLRKWGGPLWVLASFFSYLIAPWVTLLVTTTGWVRFAGSGKSKTGKPI